MMARTFITFAIFYAGLFINVMLLTAASVDKPIIFHLKSETVNFKNGVGFIEMDFDSSSRIEVRWCKVHESPDPDLPGICLPLNGNAVYKIDSKISMFYFSYVGSTLLQKFNDEPVSDVRVQFLTTDGRFVYEHTIPIASKAVNGHFQHEQARILSPEIIQAPPPDVAYQPGQFLGLKCTLRARNQFDAAWYYSSAEDNKLALVKDSARVELYSEVRGYSHLYAGHSKVKVNGALFDKNGKLEHETNLEIGPMGKREEGIYVCAFSAKNRLGDSIRLSSRAKMEQ